PGGDVHDAADVHRADLRHDFIAVRALPWYHHPVAVFDPGRRRDRQRGDPDTDRQRLLSAAPPAHRGGAGTSHQGARGRHAAASGSEQSRLTSEGSMFGKILCANDGSERASGALALAMTMA